ncbi:hypothetical protein EVAR_33043_1 [Eumeta japonica]|uniref:Uncharacterized protein n=1 Tax=Eumeta variegata TaxID=151549 RepID=A0A4C1WWY4_EUMVA|nr:hypothetical protein EVAR_33043_1 [Eumeta japonica]
MVKTILWPTWLQHKNGLARSEKSHTLTEYGREVAAFVVALRPLNESSGGPIPLRSTFSPSDILFILERPAATGVSSGIAISPQITVIGRQAASEAERAIVANRFVAGGAPSRRSELGLRAESVTLKVEP